MSDLEVRAFREGEERAVNDAFNRVFGLDRGLVEWAWKFPSRAEGRPISLAWWGDQLVAHNGGLPAVVQVDGRCWPALQSVDTFSLAGSERRPEWRSAWVAVMEHFAERFGRGRAPLLYGFPGRRSRRQAMARCGYGAVPAQEVGFLVREPGPGRRTAPSLLYRAELARDREPRLDDLWARVSQRYPVAVVRDAARQLQRLAGHPRARYHRFLVLPRLGEAVVAYAAFSTAERVCRLVDLVWDDSHPGALDLVTHLSTRLARSTGCSHEELWLSGDEAAAARLTAVGFEPRPQPAGAAMVLRSLEPALDLGRLDGRWYLTMADADLV